MKVLCWGWKPITKGLILYASTSRKYQQRSHARGQKVDCGSQGLGAWKGREFMSNGCTWCHRTVYLKMVKTVVHIYTGILLSHKKEHMWVSSKEADKPRAYYTEWSKSETGKQISYVNAYIWNLDRWYWWIYLQGSSGDADIENTFGHSEGGRRWNDLRG